MADGPLIAKLPNGVEYKFTKDGHVTCVGRGQNSGFDIFWSLRAKRWVIVNHNYETVEFADKIAAISPLEVGADLAGLVLASDTKDHWLFIVDVENLPKFRGVKAFFKE